MTRLGIEPATSRSQSGRSTTEPLYRYWVEWEENCEGRTVTIAPNLTHLDMVADRHATIRRTATSSTLKHRMFVLFTQQTKQETSSRENEAGCFTIIIIMKKDKK